MADNKNNIMASFLNKKTIHGNGAAESSSFPIKMIDINKILPNEHNCYAITNPEGLAFEMELNGNHVDPLEVTDNGDGTYRLIAGHRRRAAVLLRLERGDNIPSEVPCMIKAYKDDDVLTAHDREIIALIASNAQRVKTVFEKLNEIKVIEPLARKLYEKMPEKNLSGSFRKFFAENFLAISSSALQRLQSLEKLVPEGRQAVEDGILSETAAAVLASLDEDGQLDYLILLEDGKVDATVSGIQKFKNQRNGSDVTVHDFPDEADPAGDDTADTTPGVETDGCVDEQLQDEESTTVMADDEPEEDFSKDKNNTAVPKAAIEKVKAEETAAEEIGTTSITQDDDDKQAEKTCTDISTTASISQTLDNESDAEKAAMNWVISCLKSQIQDCDMYIQQAIEKQNPSEEAMWCLRKGKLLLVISTFSD